VPLEDDRGGGEDGGTVDIQVLCCSSGEEEDERELETHTPKREPVTVYRARRRFPLPLERQIAGIETPPA
jgi:hypothetical protein